MRTLLSTLLFLAAATSHAHADDRLVLGLEIGPSFAYVPGDPNQVADEWYGSSWDDDETPSAVSVGGSLSGFVGTRLGTALDRNGNETRFFLGYQPVLDVHVDISGDHIYVTHRHFLSVGLDLNRAMGVQLGGGLLVAHALGDVIPSYTFSVELRRALGRRGAWMTIPLRMDVYPDAGPDGDPIVEIVAGPTFGWRGVL